jgi:hypothetical protein
METDEMVEAGIVLTQVLQTSVRGDASKKAIAASSIYYEPFGMC